MILKLLHSCISNSKEKIENYPAFEVYHFQTKIHDKVPVDTLMILMSIAMLAVFEGKIVSWELYWNRNVCMGGAWAVHFCFLAGIVLRSSHNVQTFEIGFPGFQNLDVWVYVVLCYWGLCCPKGRM